MVFTRSNDRRRGCGCWTAMLLIAVATVPGPALAASLDLAPGSRRGKERKTDARTASKVEMLEHRFREGSPSVLTVSLPSDWSAREVDVVGSVWAVEAIKGECDAFCDQIKIMVNFPPQSPPEWLRIKQNLDGFTLHGKRRRIAIRGRPVTVAVYSYRQDREQRVTVVEHVFQEKGRWLHLKASTLSADHTGWRAMVDRVVGSVRVGGP